MPSPFPCIPAIHECSLKKTKIEKKKKFLPLNRSNINKTYNDLKILKLPNFILLQNSLLHLWMTTLKNKFPTHLSTIFQKSGSQNCHRMHPHLETMLLYQNLTQTFKGKNSSNINVWYMEQISEATQDRSFK